MGIFTRLFHRGFVIWDNFVYVLDRQNTFLDQDSRKVGYCLFPNGLSSLHTFGSLEQLLCQQKGSSITPEQFTSLVKKEMSGSPWDMESPDIRKDVRKEDSLQNFFPDPALFIHPAIYVPSSSKQSHYVQISEEDKSLKSYFTLSTQMFRFLFPLEYRTSASLQQTIQIPLESYALKASDSSRFRFDATNLCLDVLLDKKIILLRPPYVPSGYENPYVFDSGNICFNGEQRWKDKGIHFGEPLSLRDAVSQAALAFWETRYVLTNYFGNTQKVHSLETYFHRRR